jgi:hypothetical protein
MSGTMRRTKRPRAATKKELIIDGGLYRKGFVEVGRHDTLANVRDLIHEEFDDDMLPTYATFSSMMNDGDDNANANATARDDFYFLLDGVRLNRGREPRKLAWDWVGQTVQILATSNVASGPAVEIKLESPPPKEEDEDGKKCREKAKAASTHEYFHYRSRDSRGIFTECCGFPCASSRLEKRRRRKAD